MPKETKKKQEVSGRLVSWNKVLIPESEAKLSIYDSALMFGDMVFEMTRSFNKKQFKLREHLRRLYASLNYVRIPLEMTIDEMEREVMRTIEANEPAMAKDDEHRIMIDVTRGLLGIYQDTVGTPKGPNVIIADFPLRWTVASMGHLFDTGINAVITSQRAIPASLLEPKVKNRSRIHYLMANIEASQFEGKDNWALLLDPDGFIAEGTGDNFFIVKDGVVITPEGRNILRGISRDYIFELGKELRLSVIEKNIEPYDVYNADEAFMTGTPFCLLPVTRLNGKQIGAGKMGEVTERLLNTWSKNVGVDIAKQIQKWGREAGSKATGTTPYQFKAK
ncbi:MAG: branched-chain amino acid aminotransferase [Candidatus Taylorbacteria bacterium]|nr:branched-chain amino acid aminotransferase [Candidatus Taylorbacteria bacterium]